MVVAVFVRRLKPGASDAMKAMNASVTDTVALRSGESLLSAMPELSMDELERMYRSGGA